MFKKHSLRLYSRVENQIKKMLQEYERYKENQALTLLNQKENQLNQNIFPVLNEQSHLKPKLQNIALIAL
jgi:hypothetical protein